MTESSDPRREYIDIALEQLNDIRVTLLSLRPLEQMPKGVRRHSQACPVACALRRDEGRADTSIGLYGSVAWATVTLPDHRRVRKQLPSRTWAFLRAFDSGAFPDLELPERERVAV